MQIFISAFLFFLLSVTSFATGLASSPLGAGSASMLGNYFYNSLANPAKTSYYPQRAFSFGYTYRNSYDEGFLGQVDKVTTALNYLYAAELDPDLTAESAKQDDYLEASLAVVEELYGIKINDSRNYASDPYNYLGLQFLNLGFSVDKFNQSILFYELTDTFDEELVLDTFTLSDNFDYWKGKINEIKGEVNNSISLQHIAYTTYSINYANMAPVGGFKLHYGTNLKMTQSDLYLSKYSISQMQTSEIDSYLGFAKKNAFTYDKAWFDVDAGVLVEFGEKSASIGYGVSNLFTSEVNASDLHFLLDRKHTVALVYPITTDGTIAVDLDLFPYKDLYKQGDRQFVHLGYSHKYSTWNKIQMGLRYNLASKKEHIIYTIGVNTRYNSLNADIGYQYIKDGTIDPIKTAPLIHEKIGLTLSYSF